MKYISSNASGAFDLVQYEDYLDEQREHIARRIEGDELLTIDRFGLSDPGSFHDARLEHLSVTTSGAGPKSQIELRLKGPYFDRHFELLYEEVVSCKVDVPTRGEDLIIHEIRLQKDLLAHELLFSGGYKIEILCGKLWFREILINGEGK